MQPDARLFQQVDGGKADADMLGHRTGVEGARRAGQLEPTAVPR